MLSGYDVKVNNGDINLSTSDKKLLLGGAGSLYGSGTDVIMIAGSGNIIFKESASEVMRLTSGEVTLPAFTNLTLTSGNITATDGDVKVSAANHKFKMGSVGELYTDGTVNGNLNIKNVAIGNTVLDVLSGDIIFKLGAVEHMNIDWNLITMSKDLVVTGSDITLSTSGKKIKLDTLGELQTFGTGVYLKHVGTGNLVLDVNSGNIILSDKGSTLFSVNTVTSTLSVPLSVTGGANIGDGGSTNYSAFESDGTLVFVGNATTWEDINIDLSPLQSGGTAPGFSTYGGIRLRSWATGEEVDGSFEIPHAYKLSSTMTFHIHFLTNSVAPTGTDYVKWEVEYWIVDNGGSVSGGVTTIDTGDIAVTAALTRYDANFTTTLSHAALGGQLGFKISRITATGDAYTQEVGSLTAGVHFEMDMTGSRQITTK